MKCLNENGQTLMDDFQPEKDVRISQELNLMFV